MLFFQKMEVQEPLPINNEQNNVHRPLANFPPTEWAYCFASVSVPIMEFESYNRQVEELKESIKEYMSMAFERDTVETIEFINILCRLGISYHFQNEIEDQVKLVFDALPNLLENNDYDLYTVALLFRVLRQHGYKVSSDVFNKFKDSNGEFKKAISDDVKGILSLYEATYLRVHEEHILEEALTFTRKNLEYLAARSSPHLAKHIKNALTRPIHKGIPRIEARQYISFYEEDEFRNETVLKFAKLDFNRVQLLHQQELGELSRWWKDLNLVEKLPYARDRIVEVYFWANGMHFEPEYALSRMMSAKCTMMISLLDDTYDAYGTTEELQHFTNAIERCSIDAIDQLPAYMKVIYEALINLFDEIENELSKEGRSYGIYYLKEAFKELARAYYAEAQWSYDGYVPPFQDYVRNGTISSSYGVSTTASTIGVQKVAGVKEYEWVKSVPKIIKAGMLIGRLMNDIVGHEEELKRGDCATSVECYMKEYQVSEKVAIKELQKMNANAWKDVNKECMRPTAVPMILLNFYVNLIRVTDFVYRFDDAYTIPLSLKDHIISLFVEKIPV